MKINRSWFHDLFELLKIACIITIILTLFFFLIGYIAGLCNAYTPNADTPLQNAIEIWKDGCLATGAICLFLFAGLLITKGKHPEKVKPGEGWRSKFVAAGYQTTACVMAITLLISGNIADLILLNI